MEFYATSFTRDKSIWKDHHPYEDVYEMICLIDLDH